jgi:hypothetical protein
MQMLQMYMVQRPDTGEAASTRTLSQSQRGQMLEFTLVSFI